MIQKPECVTAIVTVWRYGDEVTQYLSIVDGPTGLPDTARIAYTMVNRAG